MPDPSFPNQRLSEQKPESPLLPAIFAGLGAALVGGIIWTVVMAVTGYEVGYAAWALGGLVGFAMSHTTARRGATAGTAAAGMALVGLIIARVLIAEFVLVSVSIAEVHDDPDLMLQAVAFEMQLEASYPEGIQSEYDAIPDGDTISDALWERMLQASEMELEAMDETRQTAVAEQFLVAVFGQIGLIGRVTAQFGLYDVLWVLLAVSTAWGMMKKADETAVAETYEAEAD